jgi:hypothetical protein
MRTILRVAVDHAQAKACCSAHEHARVCHGIVQRGAPRRYIQARKPVRDIVRQTAGSLAWGLVRTRTCQSLWLALFFPYTFQTFHRSAPWPQRGGASPGES